jgi:L-2,4-diaminobutyric acid acetyltransferase
VPCPDDGPAVWKLVAECPPLDVNSAYCNLLQCTHFTDTCVLAEDDGGVIGWVSAYRPPSVPNQVFVWQVAVDIRARGRGLGGRMLDTLLARPALRDVTTLAATITEENAASWSLFTSLARRHGARMDRRPMFDRAAHFVNSHASEHLVTISPLVAGTQNP